MFCAHMVGKPVTAPDPIAAPAVAAVPFSNALLLMAVDLIILVILCSPV
jgi:hypothetical protein